MWLFDRLLPKAMRALFLPAAKTNCQINKRAKICSGTQITNSSMGTCSYTGHDCFILKAEIGSYVSIADNVRIGGYQHNTDNVSTSPVFYKGKNIMKTNYAFLPETATPKTVIASDVWIGANACIKSGVVIGVGAVIGMGSVVTKDIPPYEIWAGNPAHKIKDRFSENVKAGLLESKWWEWPEEKIANNASLFSEPEKLIQKVKEEI